MALTYETIDRDLLAAVPEFGESLREHYREYDELLQHVLFGDLVRFVESAWRRGDQELVSSVLRFVDRAIREGDERVKNLVCASFIENVGPHDPEIAPFIDSWPARLREEAWKQRDWKPHSS